MSQASGNRKVSLIESGAQSRTGTPGLVGWMRSLVKRRSSDQSLKNVLEEVIQEHEDETGEELSTEEKVILTNMLSIGEMTVHDVMVPRADIVAVSFSATLDEIKRIIRDKRVSRLPVYKGNLDRIRGFIHLKDLVPALAGDEEFEIQKVMRDISFVSPSMRVVDLLMQMRISGEHITMVVDEYGGTDGLVTMEDLFESLVGDIQDEHDTDEPADEIKQVGINSYEAYARLSIDKLEEALNLSLKGEEDAEYDTLGGFIFARMGRVPVRGEIIDIPEKARIDILEADPRRVRKVRIHLKRPSPEK